MTTIRELLMQASALLHADRLDEAQVICSQLLVQRPCDGHGLHLMGLIEHQRGHSATAIEHLCESIRYGAAEAKWHFHLGIVYRTAG